jgi:hypothetical protein
VSLVYARGGAALRAKLLSQLVGVLQVRHGFVLACVYVWRSLAESLVVCGWQQSYNEHSSLSLSLSLSLCCFPSLPPFCRAPPQEHQQLVASREPPSRAIPGGCGVAADVKTKCVLAPPESHTVKPNHSPPPRQPV